MSEQIATVTSGRPELEAAIESKCSTVQALRTELDRLARHQASVEMRAETAREKVKEEQHLLALRQTEMSDALHKATMLEQSTASQRDEALRRIEELRQEIHELRDHHTALFKKWRKTEEKFVDANASTESTKAPLQHPQRRLQLSFSVDGTPMRCASGRDALIRVATVGARTAMVPPSSTFQNPRSPSGHT